jgi:hypothetical protein
MAESIAFDNASLVHKGIEFFIFVSRQAVVKPYQRLNKDVSRKKITKEERDRLYALALDLHFDARQDPDISFEEFDTSLATENLCAICGIRREFGQVGRPKKC